ncbi:MAG: restriction endonuclease subunit S [Cyanobacteriota bacterium]|nr:restriction endonuclease subunit S [Cyanobacteriota bacterium]
MKVSLSEIAEFITDGTHGSPERTETGVPVLSAQNVTGGALTYSTGRYTSEEEYQAFKKRLDIAIGDVLITIFGSIGRAAIVSENRPAIFQRSVAVIRPKRQVADPSYLLHLFHSSYFQSELYRNSNQSSQAGVYLGRLGSIEIPLPPLEEQRRIAAILDKSNEILSLRPKSLVSIESLTDSIFLTMFGNSFSADSGRSHVPFEDMTERITYGFTSPMTHMDSGIPILTAKNIQDGSIDLENVNFARRDEFDALTSKCKPAPGDILITKDGSIGRCAIAPAEGPLCINQSVALVIPDRSRVVPEYVSAYGGCTPVQQRIQRMGKGNALKYLRITELAEFPSGIPSLADQMEFADLIAAVGRKRDKSKAGVLEAEKMAQSLCFSLFECTFDKHRNLREEPGSQDSRLI